MAVPASLSTAEPAALDGPPRGRWAPGPAVDPAARTAIAGLCDAIEGEVVNLTRRLGACQVAAQDDARSLAQGLDQLAALLATAASAGGRPVADPDPAAILAEAAARAGALVNLAASLGVGLDRCVELVQALPRRTIPLLRRSELTDRRRHARVPVARACSLLLGGRRGAGLTLDLSEGGALVRPLEPWPELEDVTGLAELELEGVGRLPALLVGRSPAGLHLAFRMAAPAVRAALGQLLREARRAERALLATARRIVDDLLSWHLDAAGRPTDGSAPDGPGGPGGDAVRAEQVLELHLRREPRLVAVTLLAADGRVLAARAGTEPPLPEPCPTERTATPGAVAERPPEAGGRASPRCAVVLAGPPGGAPRPWLRLEAEVADAARSLGTLRLDARP